MEEEQKKGNSLVLKNPADIYEPGLETFEPFNPMEMHTLQEYALDLNMVRACKEAGYNNPSQAAMRMKKKPKIRAEMMVIHKVWQTNLRMTAEHASAKHIQMMQKFEEDYDALSSTTDGKTRNIKGDLAKTLGKMSDSYLKATGQFTDKDVDTGQQITINIDLGDGGHIEVDNTGKKARISKKGTEE